MRQNRNQKKIQTYQLWGPALNLQHRRPFSSASLSPRPLCLLLQPEGKTPPVTGGGCTQTEDTRGPLQFYHFQLSLSERGFVWNDVVFLVEGVKQEELVPLGATAHQGAGLWRSHQRRRVTTKASKPHFLQLTKHCAALP